MRRIVAIIGLVFAALTIVGAGYVLLNYGNVSAGYAAVPMVLTLACFGYIKATEEKKEE